MQYLLNATAIWLISLLSFDLLLRKESYHRYNRFYLLTTFILGLVLPLIANNSYEQLRPTLRQPVENIISVRETVVNKTQESTYSAIQWIELVYWIGVVLSLIMLASEVVKLITYYRNGSRWKEGAWTIVATGREHAPFSIMKLFFVSSRQQYSDEEWHMLCHHEHQHAMQFHLADLVVMQLARIVLWFHPLIYVYNQRLLMVHEFQADSTSKATPSDYGKFLVEQSLLGTAPTISHSFNRSPIKKRIIMLTRRSSKAAKTKMLAFIPIVVVSIFCFSQNGFSQNFERKGNTVTYRGNKFKLSDVIRDTIEMEDPVTGQRTIKVMQKDPEPMTMNGQKIYNPDNVTSAPAYTGADGHLWNHVIREAKDDLMLLGDGEYVLNVNKFIIDDKGNIVYYNYMNVSKIDHKKASSDGISKDMQQRIANRISRILAGTKKLRPAMMNGKKVICEIYDRNFWNHFKIEGKKLFIQDEKGAWTEL